MQASIATLSQQPFFKGMTPRHLAILAESSMQVEFRAGEFLFREGDPANRFYLIEEGAVTLESGVPDQQPVVIQTLNTGDEVGWSWLFPPHQWNCDARAARLTKAVFLYGTWLRERCELDRDFGFEMMKRTAEIVIQRLQVLQRRALQEQTSSATGATGVFHHPAPAFGGEARKPAVAAPFDF